MVDREEWLKSVQKSQVSRALPKVLELEHSAVPMKNLTADSNWNEFLSVLSGFLEKSKAEEQQILLLLSDEKTVNQDDLIRLKMALSRAKMRSLTLEDCMNLPKQIIEASIQNKSFLESA